MIYLQGININEAGATPVQKEIDALQQWMQSELAAGNELDTAKLNSWNQKIQALQLEHKAEQKRIYANPTNSGGTRIQKVVSGGSALVVPEGKTWTIEQVTLQNMDQPYRIRLHDYNGKTFQAGEKIKFSMQNPANDLLGGSATENNYSVVIIETSMNLK